MKPSRRASTRRRRKSLSASPQVGTPAAPSTPFSPVPRDAPRPPCLRLATRTSGSAWWTSPSRRARRTLGAAGSVDAGVGDAHRGGGTGDAAMGRRRPPRDGRFRRHARDTPRDVRRARKTRRVVARRPRAPPSPPPSPPPPPTPRRSTRRRWCGSRAARGPDRARERDRRRTHGRWARVRRGRQRGPARAIRKPSLKSSRQRVADAGKARSCPSPSATRRCARSRRFATSTRPEVTRLCASQENYEAFIAAVARLGGVRDLAAANGPRRARSTIALVAAGDRVLAAAA